MANTNVRAQAVRFASRVGLAAIVGLAAAAMSAPVLTGPAMAQKKGAAGNKDAKAGTPQSAWVKLCETAKQPKQGPDGKRVMTQDGKPVLEDKQLCLTHHEQMTPAGVTLISAAVQKMEGVERLGMMVMVPPAVGLVLTSGLRVTAYNKDQWAKLNKKEKLDDKSLVRQQLVFTMCHQNGCTAENEATPALIDAMKKGVAMVAEARHPSGRIVAFSIPLNGFSTTYGGKPVDNKLYNDARKKVWAQIRANQLAQIKKYTEEVQQKGGAAAGGSAKGK